MAAERMNPWERWLRRPKSLWLRKAIFQVHLWTGIALGLYIFAISVSGSAVVFRNEVYNAAPSGPRLVPMGSHRLSHNELRDAAVRAYPGYKVTFIWDTRRPSDAPNQAIEIWLARNSHKKQRLFDPYTGQDLGESRPYSIQLMAWLLDFHVNLFAGKTGRLVNGLGAIFVVGLSLTGIVLWWPGIRTWRAALSIRRKTNWKRFNWDLHTVIGLWTLPVMLMFGLVGVYAGFPAPFQTLVNKIAPLDFYRPVPDASLKIPAPFVPVSTPAPRR
ncbi:MAG TPA: PepSY-associated TM helix domain-containing protein, partial [Bryobacteraceae bacterium]|nr:PepSY-associated TM helix domain-containing protein [Bryobacteraceae bacterium]